MANYWFCFFFARSNWVNVQDPYELLTEVETTLNEALSLFGTRRADSHDFPYSTFQKVFLWKIEQNNNNLGNFRTPFFLFFRATVQ